MVGLSGCHHLRQVAGQYQPGTASEQLGAKPPHMWHTAALPDPPPLCPLPLATHTPCSVGDSKVLLCVVPADLDFTTAEAFMLAQGVDPEGKRTVGVVTKIDK